MRSRVYIGILTAALLTVGSAQFALSGPAVKQQDPQQARQKVLQNPTYKDGVKLFQSRNYAGALEKFNKLDSSGLCCDLLHYYMAQCYQKTGQTAAAQTHYEIVASRSKDPNLVRYSNYANQTLAYYKQHRTYQGQGNNFAKVRPGSRGRGGGGGGGGG